MRHPNPKELRRPRKPADSRRGPGPRRPRALRGTVPDEPLLRRHGGRTCQPVLRKNKLDQTWTCMGEPFKHTVKSCLTLRCQLPMRFPAHGDLSTPKPAPAGKLASLLSSTFFHLCPERRAIHPPTPTPRSVSSGGPVSAIMDKDSVNSPNPGNHTWATDPRQGWGECNLECI